MNKYEEKDELGRNIFKTLCTQQQWCKHIKDAEDKYSKWDLAYTSGNTQMIGEIKYRHNYDSTTYNDWILEVDKLQALQSIQTKMLAKGLSTKITYINHYKDNYTCIWDLTDLKLEDYTIRKVKLQKNDFDEEEVWKDVIYLPAYTAIFKDETDKEQSIFNTKKNEDDYEEDDYLPF